MTATTSSFTCQLSNEGNLIAIIPLDPKSTIGEQTIAEACQTHEAVLALLERIRDSEVRNRIKFYHANNTRYSGHMGSFPKGGSHPCSLETQIDFVRYRIAEKTHGIRGKEIPPSKPYCIIL